MLLYTNAFISGLPFSAPQHYHKFLHLLQSRSHPPRLTHLSWLTECAQRPQASTWVHAQESEGARVIWHYDGIGQGTDQPKSCHKPATVPTRPLGKRGAERTKLGRTTLCYWLGLVSSSEQDSSKTSWAMSSLLGRAKPESHPWIFTSGPKSEPPTRASYHPNTQKKRKARLMGWWTQCPEWSKSRPPPQTLSNQGREGGCTWGKEWEWRMNERTKRQTKEQDHNWKKASQWGLLSGDMGLTPNHLSAQDSLPRGLPSRRAHGARLGRIFIPQVAELGGQERERGPLEGRVLRPSVFWPHEGRRKAHPRLYVPSRGLKAPHTPHSHILLWMWCP